MAVKNLNDLFLETLKDVYYVEKKLTKALPKLMKKATEPELKQGLQDHLAETEEHVSRVEEIFTLINKPARAKRCEAIDGITSEADETLEEIEEDDTIDAGIISCAQAAEHYEIARYGTLAAWAKQLGLNDAAKILEQTLGEEKAADKKLSQLALSSANQQAAA